MRNLTTILCLTIAVLLGSAGCPSSVSAGSRIGSLKVDGYNYSLPFPEGFCDATETLYGIAVVDALRKMYAKNPALGEPRLVYRLCNANEDQTFPWGFVGIFPETNLMKDQVSFNKFRRKILKNEKLVQKFVGQNSSKTKNALLEQGIELEFSEIGKPSVIWDDQNVSIMMIISKARQNGRPYNELQIAATTVINGRIINLTTFDEVGNFLIPKAYILKLAKNAARFKSMNKTHKNSGATIAQSACAGSPLEVASPSDTAKWDNCRGTIIASPASKFAGDKFVGTFKRGKPFGQGSRPKLLSKRKLLVRSSFNI